MTPEEARKLTPELEAIAGGRDNTDTLPLLSTADLASLPPLSWLLETLLPTGGLSVLYGPSGVGKSFLALDWSLCVAGEMAWYGRASTGGWVVYIAAEGVAGLHPRVDAWQTARSVSDIEPIRFVPEAVNLLDKQQLDRARRTLEQLDQPAALVVVDTMARTMLGGDENSARDVGLLIDGVDTLRADSGAAALIVHHTGKSGDEERGSSALRGAADMMHALKPDGAGLRLECAKAKDSEPYEPWKLHLATVAESCVLRVGSNQGRLSDAEHKILETLPEAFGSEPAPTSKLLAASGIPERSYYRALTSLEERGLVDRDKHGRTVLYSLTTQGQQALLPTPANHCQADEPITAATATPLGVAGGSQLAVHDDSEPPLLTGRSSETSRGA